MTRNRSPSLQTRKVLTALLHRPVEWRYGYELAKLAGLSSGTLYPLLIRLHERGLLEARWEASDKLGRPARHVYRLSNEGAAFARPLVLDDVDAFAARNPALAT